jgi:hypothetical protein
VQYIGQVTMRATDAVDRAREAGAERSAPFEYTTAVEYLHKAREEEGYADHQAAIRFGKYAETMANRAYHLAKGEGEAPPLNKGENEPAPLGQGGATK